MVDGFVLFGVFLFGMVMGWALFCKKNDDLPPYGGI